MGLRLGLSNMNTCTLGKACWIYNSTLCMYLNIYVYICMWIHIIEVFAWMYVCMNVCMYVCMYVCMCIHVLNRCVWDVRRAPIWLPRWRRVPLCHGISRESIYIHTYMYIHTCTYILHLTIHIPNWAICPKCTVFTIVWTRVIVALKYVLYVMYVCDVCMYVLADRRWI